MSIRWVVMAAFFLVLGCYEGWEYDGAGPGEGRPSLPVPEDDLPLFYTLIHAIYPSYAALDDPTCSPTPGTADYRQAEYIGRTDAIREAFASVSETVIVRPVIIGASDCTSLTAIRAAAIATAPWQPEDPPGDDPLDRAIVHVKAVFWDGDVARQPPSVVTAADWTAWAGLQTAGRRAVSIHHFVRTTAVDGSEGYFTAWEDAVRGDRFHTGQPIEEGSQAFDPTPEGVTARGAILAGDAESLVQYTLSNL